MIESELNYIGCQKSGAYAAGVSKVSGIPLGAVDLLIFIVNWWVTSWLNTQIMRSHVLNEFHEY